MSHLTVATVGHVRVVRLDRPERKNALTPSLGWSVVGAIGDAHAEDDGRRHPDRCGHGAPAPRVPAGRYVARRRPHLVLPTLVGHENALRFLLGSRFVDADEAHGRGLVSEVVPADQLDERLLEFCQTVAAQAPLAVRRTKRLVAKTPLVTDVDVRMTEEIRNALAGLRSEDGQEAVQAIIEKRRPEFRGR